MTTLEDLVRLPIPDGLHPSVDAIMTISSFWLTLSSLPNMNYKELSEELVTFLYNSGYKVVKLENKDLQ
jgi:hypothetical protein